MGKIIYDILGHNKQFMKAYTVLLQGAIDREHIKFKRIYACSK